MVPQQPEEFTAEWVNSVLTEIGLSGSLVSGVTAELIGEGTGFVGRSVRLTLNYQGDPGERPRTLVAKIPTISPVMKQFGLATRAYDVEGRFYEKLSDQVPVNTPRLYWQHADVERETFCLLLEDLADYSLGDQMASQADESLITTLVKGAARTHADWWNDARLDSESWLPSAPGPELRVLHAAAMAGAETWQQELRGDYQSDTLDRVVEAMSRLPELAETAAEGASTIVHGDYRLDNVMLTSEPGKPSPVIIDWQLVHRGSGALDIAYLLSQSVPTEQRRARETGWIGEYLTTLDRPDHSEDTFKRDFAVGLIRSMAVPFTAAGTIPQSRELQAATSDPDLRAQLEVRLAAATQLVRSMSERGMAAIEDHGALELVV